MNAGDPEERSSRVEREVREILERSSAAPSPVDNVQATVRRQSASARARLATSSRRPWQVREWPQGLFKIGAALLFAIGAALIADAFRLAAILLAMASAIAFFSLWVPTGPSRPGDAPRWRGEDLRGGEDPPGFDLGRIWPRRGPKGPPR
ncbi:MAG: hypothetical protein K0R44_1087 [Thermomicrobiales bacterium]|nr:hypothetical protein [Thermomicrobiales bacterium]